MSSVSLLLGLGMPGPFGMLIIGVLAVLLFGDRLPEVARSLGKSLSELKKGLRDVEEEIRAAVDKPASSSPSLSNLSASIGYTAPSEIDEREEPTAPKFEPPPADPQPKPAEADTSAKTTAG